MNLIKDILEIVETNDKVHDVGVKVGVDGVTVYLNLYLMEKEVIPIRYDFFEEFCYIPHKEYLDLFKPEDFGIDFDEVKLIMLIMEYLESHKEEINKLCEKCCAEEREENHE